MRDDWCWAGAAEFVLHSIWTTDSFFLRSWMILALRGIAKVVDRTEHENTYNILQPLVTANPGND